MRCTYYKNTFGDKLEDAPLSKIVGLIRDGYVLKTVFELRQLRALSMDKYKEAKVKLFSFTPSGVFRKGYSKKAGKENQVVPPHNSDILEYNNIVIVDFDKLDEFDLENVLEKVRDCEYTHVCFISPSGCGVKVFVKVGGTVADHKKSFKEVNDYYKTLTGVKETDPSGSNVSRLCYMSSDPSIVYREDSKVFVYQNDLFSDTQRSSEKATAPVAPIIPKSLDGVTTSFTKLLTKLERDGINYTEGNKHEYMKRFALNAYKYGLAEKEVLEFALDNFDAEQPQLDLIPWAYRTLGEADAERIPSQKEFGIYPRHNKEKIVLKNEKEAPVYKAELFREYEDLVEQHTGAFSEEQLKEFEDDKWAFREYLDSLEIKDSKFYSKILNTYLAERALKEKWDFRYNLMNGQFEYKAHEAKKFAVMDDAATNSLHRDLIFRGTPCTPSSVKKSIESEFSPKVHPLRLLFLEWNAHLADDKTDYIDQVASLVKTDAPKGFWNIVFKKWIVASVANVFVDDYCTNRSCPILTGAQETGKTKFFKSLWPREYPEYFYVGEIDLKKTDATLRLVDTFLIVIDEQLSMMENQKEWEALKSLISLDRVKQRRVWGKSDTMAPRIANFCGSVNPTEFLTDPTGNTRFLTFKVIDHIDLNAFKELDMKKFWGQAYALHKQSQDGKFNYLLDEKEKKIMREYQEKFKKYDVEHDLILDIFQVGTESDHDAFLTTTEIWKALTKEYTRLNLTTNKIGSALKFLGFHRQRKKRDDGGRVEGWFLKNIKQDSLQQTG